METSLLGGEFTTIPLNLKLWHPSYIYTFLSRPVPYFVFISPFHSIPLLLWAHYGHLTRNTGESSSWPLPQISPPDMVTVNTGMRATAETEQLTHHAHHIMQYSRWTFPDKDQIKVLLCVETSGYVPFTYEGAKIIYLPFMILPILFFFLSYFQLYPSICHSPQPIYASLLPWSLNILTSYCCWTWHSCHSVNPDHFSKHNSGSTSLQITPESFLGHIGPYTHTSHFIPCHSCLLEVLLL